MHPIVHSWAAVLAVSLLLVPPATRAAPAFEVQYPVAQASGPLDGRLLLVLSPGGTEEPRFQVGWDADAIPFFGIDVQDWRQGTTARVDADALGFPLRSLADLPAGKYRVQAVLNRYETFRRADGHTLKLPPDRGEGQQWNRKPGNLYSTPVEITWDPRATGPIALVLDQQVPPVAEFQETRYVRHVRIRSERLSKFWGRDVFLGAFVTLPWGFDERPDARYPLVINHGHFASAPDPRVLLVQLQHPTPFYDDSYAVNSANNGPYGDAIQYELIPEIERRFRGLGQGWARFVYGGSTGGWIALAVQTFYPDEYNGAWVACPDPIDFRHYTVVDIYSDRNAYWLPNPYKRTPRPGARNGLGHVQATLQETNQYELALGTHGRSGEQWDAWESVYSPVGADGYPRRIWDRMTGAIDPVTAAYWREHYDLAHILERDWQTLGPKLRGKLRIYVGDMDNYYLNNAVYPLEQFLRTASPPADAVVDYGDRAEHCWNGDHTRPNAYSRLRYPQMVLPWAVERMLQTAPPGADTRSWRY